MDINQLTSMLREGLSPLEFEAIKDTSIDGSQNVKVGDYIRNGVRGEWIVKNEEGYRFGGEEYDRFTGALQSDGVPAHIINPNAHRMSVKNIFDTSHYNHEEAA